MPTLTDRLHQLSADAPTDLADDGLWVRGKRLQRRRRLVSGVVACVLVVAVGSLTTLVVGQARESVAPASGTPRLPMPDRLYTPSPWTTGTDDGGPSGPLVAVVGAERSTFWGRSSIGLAGVSPTGEYRFLDLPDSVDPSVGDVPVALSPDGRFVAYALTGSTTGEPALIDGYVVTGIGVYDTLGGEVVRHDPRAEHGLSLRDLDWVDDDTLLLDYGVYDGPGTSGSASTVSGPPLLWHVRRGEPQPVPSEGDLGLSASVRDGDPLVVTDGRRLRFVGADGRVSEGPVLPGPVSGGAAVSPDGTRVAYLRDVDGVTTSTDQPLPLAVAGLDDPDGSARDTGAEGQELIGWRDAEHVVVLDYESSSYRSVDVATGETTTLTTLPASSYAPGILVAADAVRGPVLDAPEPDRTTDPRLLLGLGGVVLVLLAWGVGRWRVRVR